MNFGCYAIWILLVKPVFESPFGGGCLFLSSSSRGEIVVLGAAIMFVGNFQGNKLHRLVVEVEFFGLSIVVLVLLSIV